MSIYEEGHVMKKTAIIACFAALVLCLAAFAGCTQQGQLVG